MLIYTFNSHDGIFFTWLRGSILILLFSNLKVIFYHDINIGILKIW